MLTPEVPNANALFDAASIPANVVVPLVKLSNAPAMFVIAAAAFAATVATDPVAVTPVGVRPVVVSPVAVTPVGVRPVVVVVNPPVDIEKLPRAPVEVEPAPIFGISPKSLPGVT